MLPQNRTNILPPDLYHNRGTKRSGISCIQMQLMHNYAIGIYYRPKVADYQDF